MNFFGWLRTEQQVERDHRKDQMAAARAAMKEEVASIQEALANVIKSKEDHAAD